MCCQRLSAAALAQGKRADTYCIGGWVGSQGSSGLVRKISPPTGFDPRTVQTVASRWYGSWRAVTRHRRLPVFGWNILPLSSGFKLSIWVDVDVIRARMQLACDSVTIHSVKHITRLWTQMLTFSDFVYFLPSFLTIRHTLKLLKDILYQESQSHSILLPWGQQVSLFEHVTAH